MTILQVCGVTLSLLLFLVQVGKGRGGGGRGVVFAAALLLFSASLASIAEVVALVRQNGTLFEESGYKGLLKAVGIGVISQFTAEICRDAGEPVLAGRVEFFAKVEIILLSVPQVRAILQIAGELAA